MPFTVMTICLGCICAEGKILFCIDILCRISQQIVCNAVSQHQPIIFKMHSTAEQIPQSCQGAFVEPQFIIVT